MLDKIQPHVNNVHHQETDELVLECGLACSLVLLGGFVKTTTTGCVFLGTSMTHAHADGGRY